MDCVRRWRRWRCRLVVVAENVRRYATPTTAKRYESKETNRNTARALATNSKEWLAIAAQVRIESPMCVMCDRLGVRTTYSIVRGKLQQLHVDHIDGNDANNERSNLQTLCVRCHGVKTGLEIGHRGRSG